MVLKQEDISIRISGGGEINQR